jgi:hypothetical protein
MSNGTVAITDREVSQAIDVMVRTMGPTLGAVNLWSLGVRKVGGDEMSG